ncbi:unnamed protein product [Angiostrongylus costaricensis]|uniref:Uncharacterized protein n=1 Tax=Angiostrongylus costaricensis TaxID=334426 RepID=A0A0R3PEJ8_ANGCS|nr:unnamed protein product [Angiostrongylus costaricensis]
MVKSGADVGKLGQSRKRRLCELRPPRAARDVRNSSSSDNPNAAVSHVGDIECDEATRRRRRKQGVVAIVDGDFASDRSHHQQLETVDNSDEVKAYCRPLAAGHSHECGIPKRKTGTVATDDIRMTCADPKRGNEESY